MKQLMHEFEQMDLPKKILITMYPEDDFESEERKIKSLEDIQWMLRFIEQAYMVQNSMIVINFIFWLRRLFNGLRIDEYHADLLFKMTKQCIRETNQFKQLVQFLEKIEIPEEIPTYENNNPYMEEKDAYLDALITSNRMKAKQVIDEMIERKIPLEDIYLHVFQEAMRDVGYLWQDRKITVGQEHYCTAVTQFLMSNLYSHLFTEEKNGKRLIASAIGSELHEMGIRMVADIFEMHGWDTHFLGSNLPTSEIISYAKKVQPNIIALSITMPFHATILQDAIKEIKQEPMLKDIKIIVGGQPFIHNDHLWKDIGADAFAKSALEGVEIANRL